MSKAVLISIKPKWCELIASGKKTIEVRKTVPKIPTPFKCYIYMTATKERCRFWEYITAYQNSKGEILDGSQKIIGEFVCDRISRYGDYDGNIDSPYFITPEQLKQTCLTFDELKKYGKNDILYGWHISDLVIYDKPRELGEFRTYCKFAERIDEEAFECVSGRRYGCKFKRFDLNPDGSVNLYTCDTKRKITRPPQSWCYVEEG